MRSGSSDNGDRRSLFRLTPNKSSRAAATSRSAFSQSLSFPSSPADSEGDYLVIPGCLGIREPVNFKIAEMGRQHVRATSDALARDDEHQNTARPQPAKAVLQKQALHPPVAPLRNLIVIGRIQVQQRERVHRAMRIERVPMDDFVQDAAQLHRPKAVEFDPKSTGLRIAGYLSEGRARSGDRDRAPRTPPEIRGNREVARPQQERAGSNPATIGTRYSPYTANLLDSCDDDV